MRERSRQTFNVGQSKRSVWQTQNFLASLTIPLLPNEVSLYAKYLYLVVYYSALHFHQYFTTWFMNTHHNDLRSVLPMRSIRTHVAELSQRHGLSFNTCFDTDDAYFVSRACLTKSKV